jgi:hypothetical protein
MSSLDLRHPHTNLLLEYLDGELGSRQARQVRRHVQACWQCRAELDELQKTVGECVRYRKEALDELLPAPPSPWRDLSREFARIDAAVERPSLFARPIMRWALAAVAASSLVAATLVVRATLFPPAEKHIERGTPPAAPSATLAHSDDSPVGASPRTESGRPSVPDRVSAPAETAAPQATVGDELQAVAALHQLGADLGDPIEVAREGSHVVVSGAGLSPARQREIRDRVTSLPNTVVRFSEPVTATPEAPLPAAPDANPSPAPPANPSPANQRRLEEQLGGHVQFESFSSQLLDRNDAAMTRVYALRRLSQQFPADREHQLMADDQRLLKSLAREHIQALSREVRNIQGLASPVLLSLGASARPSPNRAEAANWQAAVADLFGAARQTDSLIAALLGAAPPDQPVPYLAKQLLTALAQLQGHVQQCDLLLTQ